MFTVHNSTADRFWRTTSKLFLLYKLAHVSDGGHNDGNSAGNDVDGGDNVSGENIESSGNEIYVTHTVDDVIDIVPNKNRVVIGEIHVLLIHGSEFIQTKMNGL